MCGDVEEAPLNVYCAARLIWPWALLPLEPLLLQLLASHQICRKLTYPGSGFADLLEV